MLSSLARLRSKSETIGFGINEMLDALVRNPVPVTYSPIARSKAAPCALQSFSCVLRSHSLRKLSRKGEIIITTMRMSHQVRPHSRKVA